MSKFRSVISLLIIFVTISCSEKKEEKPIINLEQNTDKKNIIYQDTPEQYFTNKDNYKKFKESESLHTQGNYNESLKKIIGA
ncbi:hypothetical protein [Paenimyroides viscosum]|uniref:Uncharacterized protein n=1 Tax=Paenimyroides viscosum TaxID=2488729 RepID=A0A3P1B2Q8_9FLAO|nr:hypothetical protein [Paenimyroides viscosum]RRA95281.1 hypothetical protein EG242_06575 [Paenimyroides viscosum]